MAQATLKEVVEFFKSGPLGRPLPLAEMKELTEAERTELREELDKIPLADR